MSLLTRIADAFSVLAGYHLQEWTPDRQFHVNRSLGAKRDIPYAVRRKMLDWAREMERKDPIFNRFLDLCEQYVTGPTGIRIVSASANPALNAAADAEWEDWQPDCDLGSRFSFGQRQSLVERDSEVAGEAFIYNTFFGTKPKVQFFESEQFETPPDKATDPNVFDGVLHDDLLYPKAYYLKTSDTKFVPIDASKIVHVMEPSRFGQLRALSIVYPVLDAMIDLRESIEFEFISHKDAALLSKVIKTASGEMPAEALRRVRMSMGSTSNSGQEVTTTKSEYYSRATAGRSLLLQNGDDVSQFKNDRPGTATQQFWDFVAAREGAGLGLPIEILIMRSLQGTMTRAALDMAAGFFRCRSAAKAESFSKVREHVIGNTPSPALRRLRDATPDWRKYRFIAPRAINVDVGRNSAALIAEWQAGFRTLEQISGELGYSAEDLMRTRAREFKRAREIEAEEGVSPGAVLPLTLSEQPQTQPVQGGPSA